MITLNNINLSSIDLSGIDLRGIKLGLGGRGGGSSDGFPQLPGDVTRWHFGGLTNEMMAAMDDPRIEDADHKGRFLSFKNFAWGGMSGVGGYEMNFNLWTNNVPSIPDISMSTTTTSVSVSVGNSTYNNNLIYIHMNNWDINKNHWLKVTSTYEDGDLVFKFYNDNNSKNIELPANGYVNIPAYPEFKGNYMYISTTSNKQGSFTIEQLPLYPGFILGDGVDDFAVTEKELNFEDTYTVYTAFIPFQDDPIRGMEVCGKDFKKDFYLYYSDTHLTYYTSGLNDFIPVHINQFHIIVCKRDKTNAVIKNLITGESKTFSVSELINNPGVYYLWRYYQAASYYAKAAIAGQIIANGHFTTDEEDENILNWHKKQYPWLFPDQAWTVVGKTNEDEDRATIANITGNGNDLVLSNFGFAEGSGYGLYNAAFSSKSNLQYWSKQKIQFSKSQIETNKVLPYLIMECKDELSYNIKIKMTGFDSGVKLKWGFTDGYTYIEGDGIHVLNKKSTTIRHLHIEYSEDFDPDHVVTIEQIPEYEGYLVTNGVDDKITSSAFKMGKDWTVVGDWKFINDESKNVGIIKPSSLYVYNALNGVSIFINSGSIGNNIKENKGFNAICSNGRAYDRNWTEYSELKVEEVTKSNSELKIGASSNDTTYTRMAFKNFAIYPKVLSKDDCIKAYNYLQTLKAK